MKDRVKQIVSTPWFEHMIIAFILINGAILGMETSPSLVAQYGDLMHLGNHVILGIFILEALLKMIAVAPQVDRYFRDGWNVFDFSVIVFSLIPATGEFAMIARLARLLRVFRLISTIPELRLIVYHAGQIHPEHDACDDVDECHFLYLCHHGLSTLS